MAGRTAPCCQQCPSKAPSPDGGAGAPPADALPPPDPATAVPVPNELRPVPAQGVGAAPCYMPQPEDSVPYQPEGEMGPIGPWATGRVDWGPLSGLTGTRPVVDKYSIARYSEGEWRKHNKDVIDMIEREKHRAALIDWNGRQCLQLAIADVDKNQEDNTNRLRQREQELFRWKCELEREIEAMSDEITQTEEQRLRLKQASKVLFLPQSIAGECLERRTGRMDSELCRDEVEEELMKELALTAELREIFYRTLKDVEKQVVEDKTAKQRLEYDWSDKKEAHELEALNISLNNKSTILMFKPGAVLLPDDQSTHEYWIHFTKETLEEARTTRQRSAALRSTLDAILTNASRDLRAQADKVEAALAKRIACFEEILKRLETDLQGILQGLADVEILRDDLEAAIRRMDIPMKKAQTRLENRLHRPRVENCRDEAHMGLLEELTEIQKNVTYLRTRLQLAQDSQYKQQMARDTTEREILMKRRSIEVDRRNLITRSHYPSTTALSGYPKTSAVFD